MAKVLESRESLYDQDLLAWAEQQAAHLRAGNLDQLDAGHLIEELEALAANQRRELKSRLEVLLLHLLKHEFQSNRRSRSWLSTILEQRARIADLLEESPSLRGRIEETMRRAYGVAANRAAVETSLSRSRFPFELPCGPADVLGEPEGPLDS